MNEKVFINPNTNKNVHGFLLIDIILGLAIFTATTYYLCMIAMNTAFLLQTFINSVRDYYICLFIAEALAKGMSYDGFLDKNAVGTLKDYSFNVQQIECTLHNHSKIALEVMIIRNNIVDKTYEYTCYVTKEM